MMIYDETGGRKTDPLNITCLRTICNFRYQPQISMSMSEYIT
eukprot:UN09918